MISKEKFVKYIKFLQELDEKEEILSKNLKEVFGRENIGFLNIYGNVTPKLIEMLCDLMSIKYNENPDIGDEIQYFINELDYGKNEGSDKAVEFDNMTFDLSTPEKLYDYLVYDQSLETKGQVSKNS